MGKLDFENLNGEQWVQLLCEHPEYADQCDWGKLNMDGWRELSCVHPQFEKQYKIFSENLS